MPDLYVSKREKHENNSHQEAEKKPKKETKKTEKKEVKKSEIDLEETSNPLASFATRPAGVRFETQAEEEEIILFLRKHWITNVPWILLGILLIFAPLALRWFPILNFLPTRYQLMAVTIWYLLTTIIIFERFLTWYFNVYIITDERIIDVDFHNLIYKEVSDAKIDKVQDITYRVGGAIRTLFHYGDVYIQTAAAVPNFEFLAVPKPEQVVRILDKLREEEEREFLEGRTR
jgi:membrane protein YdbS with pleckstrin-like domain